MDPLEIKKRMFAAHKILTEQTTSRQKFESIRTLIKGLNLQIDKALESCSKALTDLEKVHKNEIIELTVEKLPEITEEDKRRKKALLWFIKNWKSLQSEVERVQKELDQKSKTADQKMAKGWKIISTTKGPLGIITIIAVIIVGFSLLKGNEKKSTSLQEDTAIPQQQSTTKEKIKVILFDGKQIPLTELITGQGPDCLDDTNQAPHYHAKDHISAKALDGAMAVDPGGCGFGKVQETKIIEVE